MKSIAILFFSVLLFQKSGACELEWLQAKSAPLRIGISARRFPIPSYSAFSLQKMNSNCGQFAMKFTRIDFGIANNHGSPLRTYTSEFDRGAVFCRMENYWLTNTGVKVCVRAGGYTER